MKVGIVCPYAWDVPGGVQVHVRDLAEALLGLGHTVSVLSPVDDDSDPGALPVYVVPAGRAVPVPFNGSVARLLFGPLSTARVRRWLREGRFDVLHVHEPLTPSLGLIAVWSARGPIVATFHTANTRSRLYGAFSPALQTALEKVGGRMAVSQAARRTIVEHVGGDAVLIPNGVAAARFAGAEPLPGWPGEGGAIGFLGRIDEPRKGLDVLLAAFEQLAATRPGLRLLVAGPGEVEEVRAQVAPAYRDRVVLLGLVADSDKARVYRSVDVFCAPNLGGESFGIVLLEAMAAGTPIVASDIDAFRRVLEDGRAGELAAVGDSSSFAAALARLLDDPGRRAELVEGAHEVVADYDWTLIARRVVDVYDTVMSGAEAGVGEDPTSEDPPIDVPAQSHRRPGEDWLGALLSRRPGRAQSGR
ncbi:MAG: glycosyltransferase family 4 protein [Actinomycetota bacterium]|nr:glycosyltransferase family 4 protein [Actinomycetota bacterium]